MNKHFKAWMDSNKGQYHISFNFIETSPALKGHSTKKTILNVMVGSDYAMNGKVIWTREKYVELTGCSYSSVREVFDYLIHSSILIPINGTSNYELDFEYLQRRLHMNQPFIRMKNLKKSVPQEQSSVPQDKTSVPQDKTSVPQDNESVPQELHIDNINKIDPNRSIILEGEDDILSSSTPKPQITPVDIDLWLTTIDI